MTQMKVWILSAGSYSSWTIVGVFDSNEKLEEFKTLHPKLECSYLDDYNEPETYEVNEPLDMVAKGMWPYNVSMGWDDGKAWADKHHVPVIMQEEGEVPPYERGLEYKGVYHQKTIRMVVWATSEEHAIKIVSEKRREVLANKDTE
jgi:hypothetical protein